MIRLIVSDVDGTLVPEGTSLPDPELFRCIRRLQSQGIRFVAASGRQYGGILSVFRELENEISFIAENGAYILERGKTLFSTLFEEKVWKDIVDYIKTRDDAFVMLSGMEGTWSDHEDPPFKDMLENGYKIPLYITQDLRTLKVPVSKVAVFCPKKNPVELAAEGRKRFGDVSNILVSGNYWMDFMPTGADKGNALKKIQEHLKISPEETMAFGDNSNDIGMLKRAAESYAVSGAREDVKAVAKHVMKESMEEKGVLHILQKLCEKK